jgi:hypothetical protein
MLLDDETYKTWLEAEDETELGELLAGTMTKIAASHYPRLQKLLKATSAYDNVEYSNLLDAAAAIPCEAWEDTKALTFNVIRSSVVTLAAKVGKNKILPRIITNNAKWAKREQAMRVEKYIRGLFKQLHVDQVMEQALTNCLLSGDGFIKVCNSGDKISLERLLPNEVFVDHLDGYYGSPLAMYQSRICNVRKVMQDYPHKAQQIKSMYGAKLEELQISGISLPNMGTTSSKNSVVLIEAWHLPLSEDYPGRHVITCGNVVLFDEEWNKDYFPIVRLQFSKPVSGYYSQGLFHDIAPLQREMNFTFNRISDAQRLCSGVKIFVTNKGQAGKISASRITNQHGEIIEVEDVKDIMVVPPPALSGEQFSYLSQLKAMAYEQGGVSQLSAGSKLPQGIDGASGKAIREYTDIETERFALMAQEWERSYAELAEVLIKEIADNGEFLVKSFDRTSPLEMIKFTDLEITLDDITIAVFPASALPSRPEARFQSIKEYQEAGFIDQKSAMDMLDAPDLDSYSEIKNAPKKAVDRVINEILDKAKYMNVEPFMDLAYLVEQATLYYNFVLGGWDLEEDKTQNALDMLRSLVEDANSMMESLKETPPDTTTLPEGMSVPMAPEATGMAAAEGVVPQGATPSALPPEAMSLLGGL